MTLGYEVTRHALGHLLAIISKFAPLSIVVATLGLLNTFKQSGAKRDQDEAKSVREALNTAGAKAYLLNWSLLSNMEISATVLQLREMIECRIGKTPTVQEFESLLSNRTLMESMIEKTWRDSGTIEKFRQEALEFGQIQASLGDRIPLIQEALEVITTKLRFRFLVDTLLLDSFRNNPAYRGIAQAAANNNLDLLTTLQTLFLADTRSPKETTLQQACNLLDEFAVIASATTDKSILKLIKPHRYSFSSFKKVIQRKWENHLDHRFLRQITQRLKERLPNEAPLLSQAADEALKIIRRSQRAQQRIENSSDRIARIFKNYRGIEDVKRESERFLALHSSEKQKDTSMLKSFLCLKYAGVPDPDIDLFLAVTTGVTELLQSADARGANLHITDKQVLAKHQNTLATTGDEWSSLVEAARL